MNTIFKTGSFVDYEGKEHKFVVAGLVVNFAENEVSTVRIEDSDIMYDEYGDVVFDENDELVTIDNYEILSPVYKAISIGISICNPEDTFNEWRGKKQAEGRADKHHDRLITFSKGGICTEEAVEFFVNQTVDNLTNHPELFIKGYNKAMKRYKSK